MICSTHFVTVLITTKFNKYSITCIQRPRKGSRKSGLSQQVAFKCRFYQVDLRRGVVSVQWVA